MYIFTATAIIVFALIYFLTKLRKIDHKKIFFTSPPFLSSILSTIILIFCIFFVNNLLPEPQPKTIANDENETFTDSIRQIIQYDSAFVSLRKNLTNLKYHHTYIIEYYYYNIDGDDADSVYELSNLENWYISLTREASDDLVQVGQFGLGIIAFFKEDYPESLTWLKQPQIADFDYVNYYLGEIFLGKDSGSIAEKHFLAELELESEMYDQSGKSLTDYYLQRRDYAGLLFLFEHIKPDGVFTYALVRQIHLANAKISTYFYWCFESIINHVNLLGLIAATAIALIWLIYLVRLDIFNPNKLIYFIAMLILGGCSVILVFLIGDTNELFLSWNLNNNFLNDLLYAVFGIGFPEELAKLIPLIILIVVSKNQIQEPIDYIVFAASSALGFAFVENLLYFQQVDRGIIHGRAYLAAVGHMINSSIVAYGWVIVKYKTRRHNRYFIILAYFLLGSLAHGIYDFLLFHNYKIIFIIFFIFCVQVWIIIINNSLNNSSFFNYNMVGKIDWSRAFLIISLTLVMVVEYVLVGIDSGSQLANRQLISSMSSGGILIIFFASNLSSFNLIKGYWRDIYFSSREKRGYGTIRRHTLLTAWYFLNVIKPHNYMGYRIIVSNHPYNKNLTHIIPESGINGEVIDRIVLFDTKEPDPHWFLVKLEQSLYFDNQEIWYILIKLRYQNDSLKFQNDLDIYFRPVSQLVSIKTPFVQKESFPSFGWASVSRII